VTGARGWHHRGVSATLLARDLAAGHADKTLFSGLDLVVAPGDVVGLVGVNGAGKSTLLRMLAGLDVPQSGRVALSPPDATVGYLPQEVERPAGETVAGHLARRTGVAAAEVALERATTALTAGEAGADDAYSVALERWLALGGADLEERTGAMLAELGLLVDPAMPMTGLSGGQGARVGLAALLLSRFDVLLLDEPTNDLDLDGLGRLERFVTGQRVGMVVVSHDREFLARCVTSVVELDLAQQRVGVFGGGYESYLAERETARRHAREAFEEYADRKSGLEERGRTQRAWLDVGLRKATKKKDNDKIGRNFRVEQTEKQAAKARQTDRMIERLPEVAEPRKEWELQYSIQAAPRSGSVVAVARDVVVRRGDFTLGPVNVQVDVGDRIGVTGPNGGGKSTLLAVLLERLATAQGSAHLGASVAVGEVDQARGLLLGPNSLLRTFGDLVPQWPESEVRTLLAKFGLKAEHVLRPALSLSPGERTRAAMALLQARGVNLLVLDEPTNHLDLPAIEQLEAALAEYTGTLLLVTHDRRMLAAVSLNRRWQVDAGVVTEV
jgi:ATPase subunit of ABC transporter with duplicated ATPase domains